MTRPTFMFHALKFFLFLLAFLGAPALGATTASGTNPAPATKIRIVADIAPVLAIAREVVGRHAKLRLLVPPRMTSHDFTLKPSNIGEIERADLVIWMGPIATPGLAKLMRQSRFAAREITLNALPGTHLLPLRNVGIFREKPAGNNAIFDPHSWLDPDNAIYWAKVIAERASRIDPINRADYAAGRDRLIDEINVSRNRIKKELTWHKPKPFVQYHDAFHYFENAFGLKALGAATNVSEETTSIGVITKLRSALAKASASCVFIPADQQAERANALIEINGVTARILDALGRNSQMAGLLYPSLLEKLGDEYNACFSIR